MRLIRPQATKDFTMEVVCRGWIQEFLKGAEPGGLEEGSPPVGFTGKASRS